jgi:hypothetical protein
MGSACKNAAPKCIIHDVPNIFLKGGDREGSWTLPVTKSMLQNETALHRVFKNECRGFNLVLQTQPHVISFYGVTSKIRFMFLFFPQVSRELKVRIRTANETITADMLQTVWYKLDYRVDVCRITKGTHIDHL